MLKLFSDIIMGSFIGCGSSSCHTRTVSSSPVRMCRIFLLLLVAATIQVSTSIPPRLFDCRNIFKARVTELTFTLQDYGKSFNFITYNNILLLL